MDILKSPLKLGLTVDFGNYGNDSQGRGEYVKWFAEDTSSDGPKMLHVYMIDRHVHSKPCIFTSDDVKRLEDQLGDFALFIENFPQIDLVSFQFPYNQLSPELKCVENMDKLYGSSESNTQRKRLLESGKIVDVEKSDEMVFSFLDILHKTDFNSLIYNPIALFHAGGILPYDLIHDKKDNYDLFIGLRRKLLSHQVDYHKSLLYQTKDKNVSVGWENIPIWDAVFHDPKDTSKRGVKDYQLLTEHAFEDFAIRLALGGIHTIDVSHVVMDSHYYSQNKLELFSMEMLRREFDEIPKSLISPENYIKIASGFLKDRGRPTSEIIYHLADCNGLYGHNEGVRIGLEDSIVDWKNIVNAMRKYTLDSYGAIEVQNGHLKESYDSHVRISLRNFLSYCE